MKKIQFPTFNDGIISLYVVENIGENGDQNVEKLNLYNKYKFGNKAIGLQRQFIAEQNNVKIKKLIRIPTVDERINTQMIAAINDRQYVISDVQYVDNEMLNHIVLTLTDLEEVYEII